MFVSLLNIFFFRLVTAFGYQRRNGQHFFFFIGDNWYGKPATWSRPRAVFIRWLQYSLSEPNTLCKEPGPLSKNISTLTLSFDSTVAFATNWLFSAFGNCRLNGTHASFSASVISVFPSGDCTIPKQSAASKTSPAFQLAPSCLTFDQDEKSCPY